MLLPEAFLHSRLLKRSSALWNLFPLGHTLCSSIMTRRPKTALQTECISE